MFFLPSMILLFYWLPLVKCLLSIKSTLNKTVFSGVDYCIHLALFFLMALKGESTGEQKEVANGSQPRPPPRRFRPRYRRWGFMWFRNITESIFLAIWAVIMVQLSRSNLSVALFEVLVFIWVNDVLKWDLWWFLRPLRPQPLPGETPSATPAEGQKEAPKEGPSNGEQADGQAQKPRRQFSRRRQRNSDSTTSKVKYHLVQCLGKSVGYTSGVFFFFV